MSAIWIGVVVLAAAAGFLAGWVFRQHLGQNKLAKASEIATKMIDEAKVESENFKKARLLEAKEEIFQMRQEVENESKQKQIEA